MQATLYSYTPHIVNYDQVSLSGERSEPKQQGRAYVCVICTKRRMDNLAGFGCYSRYETHANSLCAKFLHVRGNRMIGIEDR